MTNRSKAGVIGWPIEQSRSPLIHNSWIRQHGLNATYEKVAVEPKDLESFLKSLDTNNFCGINVTIPHKEKALLLADTAKEEAKAIGAANTLWFEKGQLIAGNTDAYGFITYLKTKAPKWRANEPAMVLGAGGAARAILYALKKEGVPEIRLTNRTSERAKTLAKEFGEKIKIIPWDEKDQALENCNLLVNSTSLGMSGKPPLEINIEVLPQNAVCYDIVYVPLETELLKAAKQQGLIPIDGLGMLLHQAVPGFEKWFGIRPTVTDDLYQTVKADVLAQKT